MSLILIFYLSLKRVITEDYIYIMGLNVVVLSAVGFFFSLYVLDVCVYY